MTPGFLPECGDDRVGQVLIAYMPWMRSDNSIQQTVAETSDRLAPQEPLCSIVSMKFPSDINISSDITVQAAGSWYSAPGLLLPCPHHTPHHAISHRPGMPPQWRWTNINKANLHCICQIQFSFYCFRKNWVESPTANVNVEHRCEYLFRAWAPLEAPWSTGLEDHLQLLQGSAWTGEFHLHKQYYRLASHGPKRYWIEGKHSWSCMHIHTWWRRYK